MDASPTPPARPLITSRGEFRAAIRTALARAADAGARELWLVDPTFANWPLSEPEVVDSLTRWAAPHRRLTLLAGRFDELSHRHARWVEWRRHWAHVVECRCNAEVEIDKVPSVLLASELVCVRLLDRERYRGTTSDLRSDQVRCRESIDAVLQRSAEAFAVTTLGL